MQHIQIAMDKLRERDPLASQYDPLTTIAALEAPALWDKLATVTPDPHLLDANRIVMVEGADPACAAFDLLRTRVLQKMQQNNWTSVAVTSPCAGSGSSVIAVNLALSLAKHDDCRTLLVDLNLRHPQVASLIGFDNPVSMEALLGAACPIQQALVRCGPNMAIAASQDPVARPSELLQSARAARVLKNLKQSILAKVVVYDVPPLRPHDDTTGFLRNVDCALLVLEAEKTTPEQADACEYELSQVTAVLGTVLNKCRYKADDPLL